MILLVLKLKIILNLTEVGTVAKVNAKLKLFKRFSEDLLIWCSERSLALPLPVEYEIFKVRAGTQMVHVFINSKVNDVPVSSSLIL